VSALAVRAAGADGLAMMLDWAAAEGWNPGLRDAVPFLAADPEGFLIGEIEGEPVGCISVVRYAGDFGFLGFYIVRPQHRGRGLGLALWNAGMKRLEGRTVGLDGVVAQQPNYRKSGFVYAHANIRYGGQAALGRSDSAGIVPLDRVPWREVAALDRLCFPAPRDRFLHGWVEQPGTRALAAIDGGRLAGYGAIRPCREGRKIGPLVAHDPAVAERLFRALCAGGEGPVFLDVPAPNAEAARLATASGLAPSFETARMYRGPSPTLSLGAVYGITTFELG